MTEGSNAQRAKDRAPLPDPRDPAAIAPSIEAILMSVERPVSAQALALGLEPAPARPRPSQSLGQDADDHGDGALQEPKADPALVKSVESAISLLNDAYAQASRSFRIEHVAGGYRLMTLSRFAGVIAAFHRSRQSTRLTKAAIETLAIIAYKQPITRADLESIRGVACGEVLRSLTDRRLVTIRGRAEELGRPILYGTTRQFLDVFGLASLSDLPQIAELKPGAPSSPIVAQTAPEPTQPAPDAPEAAPASSGTEIKA